MYVSVSLIIGSVHRAQGQFTLDETDGRMDGRTDGRMGWTDGMDGWDGRMDGQDRKGRQTGWVDRMNSHGCMDRMNRWMDGWMDGWTDGQGKQTGWMNGFTWMDGQDG